MLSPMAAKDADLFIIEEFSDIDLQIVDKQFVRPSGPHETAACVCFEPYWLGLNKWSIIRMNLLVLNDAAIYNLIPASIVAFAYQAIMPKSLELPAFLRSWLDCWGPNLLDDLRPILAAEGLALPSTCFVPDAASCSSSPCSPLPFRVGTDCSGVESPVHALQALGVSFRHLFSCESAWAPRQLIAENTPPEVALLADVRVANDAVPFVDLYVSGFSCKPFSMLHGGTKLLEEPEAQIFFAVLKRIQQLQPPAFVLENVSGISRCMDEVMSLLQKAGYIVVVESLNPIGLGEPVSRPRFYFLGARADVALLGQEQAQSWYQRTWSQLRHLRASRHSSHSSPSSPSSMTPLSNRLLPNNHDLVKAHTAVCYDRWKQAESEGFPDKSCRVKWQTAHPEWEKQQTFHLSEDDPQLAHLGPDSLMLHLPRERDGWWKLIRTMKEPGKVVADISQSLGRMPCRADGALPTITPGGHIVVAGAGRCLLPEEKLLLHGLPLHKIVIPEGVSANDLESMGGNMMHLQTVGLAMLLVLSIVDWSQPAARAAPAARPAIKQTLSKPKRKKSVRQTLQERKQEQAIKARFGMIAKKVTKPSTKAN